MRCFCWTFKDEFKPACKASAYSPHVECALLRCGLAATHTLTAQLALLLFTNVACSIMIFDSTLLNGSQLNWAVRVPVSACPQWNKRGSTKSVPTCATVHTEGQCYAADLEPYVIIMRRCHLQIDSVVKQPCCLDILCCMKQMLCVSHSASGIYTTVATTLVQGHLSN